MFIATVVVHTCLRPRGGSLPSTPRVPEVVSRQRVRTLSKTSGPAVGVLSRVVGVSTTAFTVPVVLPPLCEHPLSPGLGELFGPGVQLVRVRSRGTKVTGPLLCFLVTGPVYGEVEPWGCSHVDEPHPATPQLRSPDPVFSGVGDSFTTVVDRQAGRKDEVLPFDSGALPGSVF